MKRAAALLPDNLAPIGFSREQAAAFIGIGATLFDRLIADGRMPDARLIGGRLVWDVAEVAAAFRSLPHRSESVDGKAGSGNPWD
jgi:predicted DNA-binding transcriptional regulator AlpA